MWSADTDEGRQIVRDILAELVEVCPVVRGGPGYDPDLLARLYLLRDIAAATGQLGVGRAAVADWIAQAATLVRDEQDREQALRLLQRAQARLADAVVTH